MIRQRKAAEEDADASARSRARFFVSAVADRVECCIGTGLAIVSQIGTPYNVSEERPMVAWCFRGTLAGRTSTYPILFWGVGIEVQCR